MASIDQEVRRLMGKAMHQYDLIRDGDRIAVAVSGGKDSMLLLWLLRERLRHLPISYHLEAVHVDPGFDEDSASQLEEFFRKEGFNYTLLKTDHGPRAHGPENTENPCFLCARLRRTALFKQAQALACPKIAFGHNRDDFIETFLVNICYGGQVSTMLPRQPFFKGEMTVIRPLALVPAFKVEKLARKIGLPIVSTCCPSAGHTKRQEIRDFLDSISRENTKVRGNIFHAMSNINHAYLPPPLGSEAGYTNLLDFRQKKGAAAKPHGSGQEDILPH
jgi:tRNA 2-thiocytidine biosynthesis protein TtcA